MTKAEILEQVLRLPDEERAQVASQIWASLVPEARMPQDELEAAWSDEIDARIAAAEADPTRVVPWRKAIEQVRAKLRASGAPR